MKLLPVFAVAVVAATPVFAATRGDVADMNAADDVQDCVRQYHRSITDDNRSDFVRMCAEVISEMTGRDLRAIEAVLIRRNLLSPEPS